MANGITSLIPDPYEALKKFMASVRRMAEDPESGGEHRERLGRANMREIPLRPEALGTGTENVVDSLAALAGGPIATYYGGNTFSFLDSPEKRANVSGRMFTVGSEGRPRTGRQSVRDLMELPQPVPNPYPAESAPLAISLSGEGRFPENVDDWDWGERHLAAHEFGHAMDYRNRFSPELEQALYDVGGDFYDRRVWNPDRTDRERTFFERVMDQVERRGGELEMLFGAKPVGAERMPTQFAHAFEALQTALDPSRQDEARAIINTPELQQTVEELLRHEVYRSHPWNMRDR